MRRILSLTFTAMLAAGTLTSCMKEEKPYAIPKAPEGGDFPVEQKQVSIGENYETQVYFSLQTGVVSTSSFKSWDVSFTTGADKDELWMNGGKLVLVYPTGNSNYAAVTALGSIPAQGWKYDNPSGLSGQSGLGILGGNNHLNEVLIVDDGQKNYYKLQILDISATQYKIKAGLLADAQGTSYTLDKNTDYNFTFFSFTEGIVRPEPPKKTWDILFTRYRHIYYKYNPDGSDFPYLVNGVLTNPYLVQSGGDSTKAYDFYSFNLENAKAFTLAPNRDVIGYNWKDIDINSGRYTVRPKQIYVIKDQQESLWKLHFTGFYDGDGKKGNPSFEYQRIQ
ncbi:HmuY family protein [Taibaiella helva]|uniref:HmuY family protein n=1 Tax=Taibaiella helva TaxID=2301235 RepID=UPI000E598F86|nr:HmuY family protein [Taibaiella helva]